MSYSHFIDQVQILMHTQQIKYSESIYEKSNYGWLTNKKCTLTFMSAKEEFLIREAVQKVNEEQKIKVMRQLVSWLDEHPHAEARKVPEMCVLFLNRCHTLNIINEATLSRKLSFRNSLRRLSILSNRIAPAPILLQSPNTMKRVKFSDQPKVYCISD